MGPGRVRDLTFGNFLGSWSPLGPKMAPRPPQDPSKPPLGADFTGFWTPKLMDFGTQLNGFWKDFASHLGRFLVIAWLVVRMDG